MDPNYRRQAAAGEGKGTVEARRKYLANPENRKKFNIFPQERRKALSEAELEVLRNRQRQSSTRSKKQRREPAGCSPVHELDTLVRGRNAEVSQEKRSQDQGDGGRVQSEGVPYDRESPNHIRPTRRCF